MLTWRKEKNVDEYFKKVEAVNFDIHRLPLADAFEPYVFPFRFYIVIIIQTIITKKIKKVISWIFVFLVLSMFKECFLEL